MDEYELNKRQKLFIYDKINGLIANEKIEIQNNLSLINIDIMDNRLNIEPYPDLNINQYSIEYIVDEASKIDDVFDRLRFFKHRKVEYENEASELGWDIGLGDEIQVEIDVLEKFITCSSNTFTTKASLSADHYEKMHIFIRNGQTLEAIDYLIDGKIIESKTKKFDLIQLSGQWKENERKTNLGLIDEIQSGQTRGRITNAVLNFVNEIAK
jgi:Effector-associated domain 11